MKLTYKTNYIEEVEADEGGSGKKLKVLIDGTRDTIVIQTNNLFLVKIHKKDINRCIDLLSKAKKVIELGEQKIKNMDAIIEKEFKTKDTILDKDKK